MYLLMTNLRTETAWVGIRVIQPKRTPPELRPTSAYEHPLRWWSSVMSLSVQRKPLSSSFLCHESTWHPAADLTNSSQLQSWTSQLKGQGYQKFALQTVFGVKWEPRKYHFLFQLPPLWLAQDLLSHYYIRDLTYKLCWPFLRLWGISCPHLHMYTSCPQRFCFLELS